MADQSGVPQVDFSILGNLGNTYDEARSLSLASLGRRRAAEALAQGDKQGALSALVGSGDARTLAALGQYQSSANSVYGTPIYGTDEKGNTRIGTFDKSGQFRPIETPGFTPTPGIKTVDTGTGTMVIDTRTGQPIQGRPQQPMQGQPAPPQSPPMSGGYIPKDVAGEKREQIIGGEQGKAVTGLPGIIAKAEESLKVINQAIGHKGRTTATGLSGQLDPRNYFAGTDAKNFQILAKQLEGKAFLEAFESLKGGGQITEIEGVKGTQAIARLDRAQSDEEYLSALKDLKDVIGRGVARAKNNATNIRTAPFQPPNTQARAGQRTQPVTKTIGGKTYIQNPANGDWYER